MVSRRQPRLGFRVPGAVALEPGLRRSCGWCWVRSRRRSISSPFRRSSCFAPTLDNYRQVLADNTFLRYTLNSTIVAAGATAVGLLLGIPAAYALAR